MFRKNVLTAQSHLILTTTARNSAAKGQSYKTAQKKAQLLISEQAAKHNLQATQHQAWIYGKSGQCVNYFSFKGRAAL
jgi:hypothetical protein